MIVLEHIVGLFFIAFLVIIIFKFISQSLIPSKEKIASQVHKSMEGDILSRFSLVTFRKNEDIRKIIRYILYVIAFFIYLIFRAPIKGPALVIFISSGTEGILIVAAIYYLSIIGRDKHLYMCLTKSKKLILLPTKFMSNFFFPLSPKVNTLKKKETIDIKKIKLIKIIKDKKSAYKTKQILHTKFEGININILAKSIWKKELLEIINIIKHNTFSENINRHRGQKNVKSVVKF